MIEIKIHNGKEQWKPKSKSVLVFNDDLEILDRCNSMIRGFVNYHSLVNYNEGGSRKKWIFKISLILKFL